MLPTNTKCGNLKMVSQEIAKILSEDWIFPPLSNFLAKAIMAIWLSIIFGISIVIDLVETVICLAWLLCFFTTLLLPIPIFLIELVVRKIFLSRG